MRVPHRSKILELPGRAAAEIQRNFLEIEEALNNVGATGNGGGYDAIIDPDLAADEPENFKWKTVGAALTYFSGVGYTTHQELYFGMRGRRLPQSTTTSKVVETAVISASQMPPGGLTIVGLGPWQGVTWDCQGVSFTMATTSRNALTLRNIYWLLPNTSTFTTDNWKVSLVDCFVEGVQTTSSTDNSTNWAGTSVGELRAVNTIFSKMRVNFQTIYLVDCELTQNTNSTLTWGTSVTGSTFYMFGGGFHASTQGTWNFNSDITVISGSHGAGIRVSAPAGTVTLNFNSAAGGAAYCAMAPGHGLTAAHNLVTIGATTKRYFTLLGGPYRSCTYVASTAADAKTYIAASFTGNTTGLLDITGPAKIDVTCSRLIVRGTAISGDATIITENAGTGLTVASTVTHIYLNVAMKGNGSGDTALSISGTPTGWINATGTATYATAPTLTSPAFTGTLVGGIVNAIT